MRCTVNSDDPLLFGTDTSREYLLAATEMGFRPAEVAELAKNAFRASLLPAGEIEAACGDIETAFA